MLRKSWWSALAMLVALLLSTTSYAAGAVTVPQNVTPVKSWTVVVGTTYKIPDDVKQAGDSYASSDTAIVTVDASTGQFAPQAAGVAYIVATNGGQNRYFKVTASNTAATTTANIGALNGFPVSVLNTATPAVTVGGFKLNGVHAMYFTSIDGTVLGSITEETYVAAIQAMVSKESATPLEQRIWMAEQFNLYRGLEADTGAVDEATALGQEVAEAIQLINAAREKEGLSPLSIDNSLASYAEVRAAEIRTKYSHERPDGTMPIYAEVIGVSNVTPASTQVVNSWMNSNGHSAIILTATYNYVGVAAYDNGASIYWVAVFSK